MPLTRHFMETVRERAARDPEFRCFLLEEAKSQLDVRLTLCDLGLPMAAEEREWLDAPAVGREEI
jgi:hypothetical protein